MILQRTTPLPVTVHQPSPPHAFALAGPAEGTPPAFLTDAAPTDAELDAMFASWLTDNAHRLDVCRRCGWFHRPRAALQYCDRCEDILVACEAAENQAITDYRNKRYSRIKPDTHVSKGRRSMIEALARVEGRNVYFATMLELDRQARRPTADELRQYPGSRIRIDADVDGARAMLAAARASVAAAERAAA